jgi:hypothetical protein
MAISQKCLEKFHDFHFQVNDQLFSVNHSLISCLSDKFKSIQREEQSLKILIPEECFSSFTSIMNMFEGFPFQYNDSEIPSLIFLMEYFEFSFLSKLLSDKISIPATLPDSISFLTNSISQYLEEHFQNALKIVIEHFN